MDIVTVDGLIQGYEYLFDNLAMNFTFDASGVNVDYLPFLECDSSKTLRCLDYPILKSHEDVLQEVRAIYLRCTSATKPSDYPESLSIVSYLASTELPDIASETHISLCRAEFFDYCVDISSPYQRKISIDMKNQINIFIADIQFLDTIWNQGYFYELSKNSLGYRSYRLTAEQDSQIRKDALNLFQTAKNTYNKGICIYIALWIQAFRFWQSRSSCLANPLNIISSHRSYGWTEQKYTLNEEFEIGFKTNYGFGNANYMFLVIYYKDIQVFNFMDWVDYDFAKLSDMQKYSIKYITTDSSTPPKKIIVDALWLDAIRDAKDICDCYMDDEQDFIRIYIIENLENMVSELEKIIDIDDAVINGKTREYEFKFSIDYDNTQEESVSRAKAMNVKGYMISGLLELIVEIIKLDNIISIEDYLQRIEDLNLKIYPMLEKQVISNKKKEALIISMIGENRRVLTIIWQGYKEKEGLRSLRDKNRKKELRDIDYAYYKKLESRHTEISEQIRYLEQDLNNIQKLLSNIIKYINAVDTYFSKK